MDFRATGENTADGMLEYLFGIGELLLYLTQLGEFFATQLVVHVALHVLHKTADARRPGSGEAADW